MEITEHGGQKEEVPTKYEGLELGSLSNRERIIRKGLLDEVNLSYQLSKAYDSWTMKQRLRVEWRQEMQTFFPFRSY
jgi:hypothetical protein